MKVVVNPDGTVSFDVADAKEALELARAIAGTAVPEAQAVPQDVPEVRAVEPAEHAATRAFRTRVSDVELVAYIAGFTYGRSSQDVSAHFRMKPSTVRGRLGWLVTTGHLAKRNRVKYVATGQPVGDDLVRVKHSFGDPVGNGMETSVWNLLATASEPLTTFEIAERLGLHEPSVGSACSALRTKGWAYRTATRTYLGSTPDDGTTEELEGKYGV